MTNKARALLLLQYLKQNTDENKAVTHTEIRKMFREEYDLDLPVATIRADVAAMVEAGYHIDIREVNGVATYYRYLDHAWSRQELQILIDAVASAQFITRSGSEEMIEKLRSMAALPDRDQLSPAIHVEDRIKARNEQVMEIIRIVQRAIALNHKIQFQYYVYTQDMQRVPKHDGYWYVFSPYALFWQNDRYYIVGWSEKHGDVAHFRVDRMGIPELLPHLRHTEPEDLNLERYPEEVISMYRGQEKTVTLRCRPELLNQVIDQFGNKLKITNSTDKSIDIEVRIRISPPFYGWLFQYGGEMTVIAPDEICQAYQNKAGEVLEDYMEEQS